MRWAIAALAFGLAACSSGGDSGTQVGAAVVPATTSTTISAEDSFLAEVSVKMGWEGADGQASLDTATAVCDTLTAGSQESFAADDAPADSPESDAALGQLAGDMTLDLAFDQYAGTDELMAELLTAATEHLCPEHAATVTDYIDTHGITLPD